MARVRANPLGLRATDGVVLVRIGKGEAVHIWDPDLPVIIAGEERRTGSHLCKSGKNAGARGGSGADPQPRYTDAQFVTCLRCAKVALTNKSRYGTLLRKRG